MLGAVGQDLGNTAWAAARLQGGRRAEVARRIVSHCVARPAGLGGLKAQEMSNVVWALGSVGLSGGEGEVDGLEALSLEAARRDLRA